MKKATIKKATVKRKRKAPVDGWKNDKLPDKTVRMIRRKLAKGGYGTAAALARELGVTSPVISRIGLGQSYRNVV